ASIAQPMSLGAGLKAWRGTVNGADVVFLRAQPNVVRITPAEHADIAARDLLAHPPPAPTFHANEAVRMRVPDPSRRVAGLPDDISEARVWIDSRPADAGADIYGEADCPDAAAAALVQSKNSFAVRLVTAGLLNSVEVKPVDRRVMLHVSANQQQIEALLNLAPNFY